MKNLTLIRVCFVSCAFCLVVSFPLSVFSRFLYGSVACWSGPRVCGRGGGGSRDTRAPNGSARDSCGAHAARTKGIRVQHEPIKHCLEPLFTSAREQQHNPLLLPPSLHSLTHRSLSSRLHTQCNSINIRDQTKKKKS